MTTFSDAVAMLEDVAIETAAMTLGAQQYAADGQRLPNDVRARLQDGLGVCEQSMETVTHDYLIEIGAGGIEDAALALRAFVAVSALREFARAIREAISD